MAAAFLPPCETSRRLCKAFNKLQMEDVSVTTGVKYLTKVHKIAKDENLAATFFQHFTHILKLPLSRGTSKERMTSYDEKIFEVVCQFATSFLHDEEQKGKNYKNKTEICLFSHYLRVTFTVSSITQEYMSEFQAT
jgi:hypothetical protein